MLTVVNNRRCPLVVTHPGADQQSRTPSAVELANISQLTLPGKTVLLPRDSVTYRMAGPAQLATEMDGLAQSLTALQTGAELAFEITQLFGAAVDENKLLEAALTSAKCLTVLQNVSEAGRIIRDCFTLEMIVEAFGPAAAFAAALLVLAPVLEFFRSSFNAFGDQLNGRDRYRVSVGYTKPSPPAAPWQATEPATFMRNFVAALNQGDNNTVDQYGDDAQLRRFHDAKPEAGARWQTGSGPCNAPGTCAFTYVNSANGGYSYDATLRRGGAQNHIQITIIKDLGGGA